MSINSVRSNPSPQISNATDPQAPAVPKAVYDWKDAGAQRATDSSLDSGPLRPAATQDSYTVAKNPQAGFTSAASRGAAAPTGGAESSGHTIKWSSPGSASSSGATAGNAKASFEAYQPASTPANAGNPKAYEAWPVNQGSTAQGIRS